jgi:2',3'-cyclic-nucleotide 2'-phosphodiesterase (5'-nucleotidase family)
MPEGERIVNVVIAGESLESAKSYKIAMNGFLAGGGDGHEVIKAAKGARQDSGILDIDAFVDYLKANSPLNPVAEGRIKVLKKASGLFRQNLDRAGVHVVKSGNDGSLTRIQRAA